MGCNSGVDLENGNRDLRTKTKEALSAFLELTSIFKICHGCIQVYVISWKIVQQNVRPQGSFVFPVYPVAFSLSSTNVLFGSVLNTFTYILNVINVSRKIQNTANRNEDEFD